MERLMADDRGLSFGNRAERKATDFDNNRAYVIGVNEYSNGIPPLRTAVADALRLGELLEELHGYKVRSYPRNGAPSLAIIRQLLYEILPQEVEPNDRVLFYFAGHGIAMDGKDGPEGFLVPEDANREDHASFLAMTELQDALAKLPCRHFLLILDCCFAGAFRWSSARSVSPLPSVIHRERYERYIQDAAWQVLTSAAHDQTALDVLSAIGERNEDGMHSPFAAALFRALAGDADLIPRGQKGGDGVITATELYLYLRECVETVTDQQQARQTPGLWPLKKHDKGEYILLAPGHELNLPPAPELNYCNNPYRGLQSFEEEHRRLFFGRERVINKLYSLVTKNALTIVLGASGTGKSSVVKAGLLPFLRGLDIGNWQILPVFRPHKSPLATLASLTLPGEPAGSGAGEHQAALRSNEHAFAERVQKWAYANPDAKLLLVADQFEELITLAPDKSERERFLKLMASVLKLVPNQFRLVITLRSDFEPHFLECPLASRWPESRFAIPPMSTQELREVIEGPASVRVLYFKPTDLVNRLIDEVIQTPGALPLLSFSLSELYIKYLERRGDDRCLALEDYKKLGGVVGTLRHRASEVYEGLDPAHQSTMKRTMLRMVSVEGGEATRRRVPKSELIYREHGENERVEKVLLKLGNARLIVHGNEPEGEPYVEPAHDALVRGWDRLLEWTHSETEQLTLRGLLNPAANDWNMGMGGLWHFNPRLSLLRQQIHTTDNSNRSVMNSDNGWVNLVEAEFIAKSVNRRRNTFLAIIGSVSVFLIVALLLLGFGLWQLRIAHQRRIAEEHAVEGRGFSKVGGSIREGSRGESIVIFSEKGSVSEFRNAVDYLNRVLQTGWPPEQVKPVVVHLQFSNDTVDRETISTFVNLLGNRTLIFDKLNQKIESDAFELLENTSVDTLIIRDINPISTAENSEILRSLSKLETLKHLAYINCRLKTSNTEWLKKFQSLTALDISANGELTSQTWLHLAALSRLRVLFIDNIPAMAQDSSQLREFVDSTKLERISLEYTGVVTRDFLRQLSDIKTLTAISFYQCDFEHDAFQELSRFKSLREIDLAHTNVSPPEVRECFASHPLKIAVSVDSQQQMEFGKHELPDKFLFRIRPDGFRSAESLTEVFQSGTGEK